MALVDTVGSGDQSLTIKVAATLTGMLIEGRLQAGERLSEQNISSLLNVSRNTLREAFRILSSQGLIKQIANRGAFVAAPDEASVKDIFRIRGLVENGAILSGNRHHPAVAKMRRLASEAELVAEAGDWSLVATMNMEFHRAIVELYDSPRLSRSFDIILAELRLVFGQVQVPQQFQEPYLALNSSLVAALENQDLRRAALELESYLLRSEKELLAALQRRRADLTLCSDP